MTDNIFNITKQPLLMELSPNPYNHSGLLLYRYEGSSIHYSDGGINRQIYLYKFGVIRETPKCFVIDHWGKEKFVLKKAHKRFAYPTLADAWKSFKIRTQHRIGYAQARLDSANDVWSMIQEIEERQNDSGT